MHATTAFVPPARILMGPGPSEVPARVLAALARPTIGHLDPAFIALMDEIKALLQYAFRTGNELTMPVSGPGTAGMESCVVNLVEPGDRVLVCVNGAFGGRLVEMVRRCGGVPVVVEDEWGRAVSPDRVDAALGADREISVLAFVQAETSTGALSDAKTLAAIARSHDCVSIADTVTSFAGAPLDVDGWGIDAAYAGTQKCLSVPPGLSPISLSERAVERVRRRRTPVQSWFMDLTLVMGYWGTRSRRAYHHTAPVNALYGLHEGLLALREEGLEASWERHRRNHEALRAGLEAMGLRLLVPEGERIPQLNAVVVPDGVDEAAVRGHLLEKHDLEIGAGLGALAGRIWRIGLMGHSSRPENIERCLTALAGALAAQGHAVDASAALDAAGV